MFTYKMVNGLWRKAINAISREKRKCEQPVIKEDYKPCLMIYTPGI